MDENTKLKQITHTTDVLGRNIYHNFENILLLERYNDGSVEKKYFLK